MLLHNSNINMAIAVILMYGKSLYDLPGLKCKNAMLQLAGALMGLLPKLEFAVSEDSAGPSVGFVCNPYLCEDVK